MLHLPAKGAELGCWGVSNSLSCGWNSFPRIEPASFHWKSKFEEKRRVHSQRPVGEKLCACCFPHNLVSGCCPTWGRDTCKALGHLLVNHPGFWALAQTPQGHNLKGSVRACQRNMGAEGIPGKSAFALVGLMCALSLERWSPFSSHATMPFLMVTVRLWRAVWIMGVLQTSSSLGLALCFLSSQVRE